MKLFWFRRSLLALFVSAFVVICCPAGFAEDPPAKAVDTNFTAIVRGVNYLKDHQIMVRLSGGMDSLIGVGTVPVEEVLRVQLGLAEDQGLAVTDVAKDGPGAKAGLQLNDVLITIADQTIAGVDAFHNQLQQFVDQPVKIGLVRAGARRVLELTPKNQPPSSVEVSMNQLIVNKSSRYRLGVGLASVDATLRSQLNLPDSEGLVVTSVESESPAAKAGVMVNDVLLKLDGKALKSTEELSVSLQEIADKAVALELLRRGKPTSLTVTPENQPLANFNVVVQTPAVQSFLFALPEHSLFPGDKSAGAAELHNALKAAGVAQLAHINLPTTKDRPSNMDLAHQVHGLLEQTRQLQMSVETLNKAVDEIAKLVDQAELKPARR